MSAPGSVCLLTERDVFEQIEGNAEACSRIVADAYATHHAGDSVLPNSGFLRLPSGKGRIISLPAYLGGDWDLAGVKWIASVPANSADGLRRASGVLVLNDARTGFPFACLESSAISAARTAASAVLAAERLVGGRHVRRAGFVGTGRIAAEVARFLVELEWQIGEWRLHDLDAMASERFRARLLGRGVPGVETVDDVDAAFAGCDVVFVATVASEPHLHDPQLLRDAPVVVHLSLRDLDPHLIASARNYTDDAEHAFRERTSLQLAEELFGHRDFLDGNVVDLFDEGFKRDRSQPVIFSPFGLGVLDLAVGKWVYDEVVERGGGLVLDDFFGPTIEAL